MMTITSVIQNILLQKRISLWLRICAYSLVSWKLLLAVADFIHEWSEASCAFIAIGTLLLAVVLAKILTPRFPTITQLIKSYGEKVKSDGHHLDALMMLEGRTVDELRPLERETLDWLQRRYLTDNGISIKKALFDRRDALVTVASVVAALAIGVLLPNPLLNYSWNYCFSNCGVVFEPKLPAEVCTGEDLEVNARVVRNYGQRYSTLLQLRRNGVVSSYEMHPILSKSGMTSSLVVYDCQEEFSLRVKSGRVSTSWQKIQVYDKPMPLAIRCVISPPSYTRLHEEIHDQVENLTCPAGSIVSFECTMPREQYFSVEQGIDGEWKKISPSFVAKHDGHYRLCYADRAGHVSYSEEISVTVQADCPPVIDVRSPQLDCNITRDEDLYLEYSVTDDYGLAAIELHLRIDETEEEVLVLPIEKNVTEAEGRRWLGLAGRKLVPGQLVSGYIKAVDNAMPTAQSSSSELFFAAVVPKKSDTDDNKQDGHSAEKQQSVDLNDLIIENKRLLRESVRLAEGNEKNTDIARELRSLELAVRSRAVAIATHAGMPQLPAEIQRYFTLSQDTLKKAAFLMEHGDAPEAVKAERMSLIALVQLNAILMANAQRLQGAQGQDKDGNSQETAENGTQKTRTAESSDGNREQDLRILKKTKEQLRQIIDEQRRVTATIRMEKKEKLNAYAPVEKQLSKQVMDMEDTLAGSAESAKARQILRQAVQEMKNSADKMAQGQRSGVPAAQRALGYLHGASQELTQLIQQQANAQMRYLQAQSAQLAEKQRALMALSDGKHNELTPKQLREQQQALNTQIDKLQQMTRELSAILPQGQERDEDMDPRQNILEDILSSENAGKVNKDGQRAANALRYRRFGQARQAQENIAETLKKISEKFSQAARLPSGMSNEELSHAIEDLNMLAEEAKDDAGAIRPVASRFMNNLAIRMGKQSLGKIANELADGNLQMNGEELSEKLRAAVGELQDELARRTKNSESLRTIKSNVAPPDKYRREIRHYFQKLMENE